MPGAILHILAGIISGIVVYRIMHKLEFGLAIFIGNLLPDALKLLFLMLHDNSLSIGQLYISQLQSEAHVVVNGFDFALFFMLFFLALGWLLYHYHFIKKKKLKEWDELIIYLVIGYVIHIIMDATILTSGVWI